MQYSEDLEGPRSIWVSVPLPWLKFYIILKDNGQWHTAKKQLKKWISAFLILGALTALASALWLMLWAID